MPHLNMTQPVLRKTLMTLAVLAILSLHSTLMQAQHQVSGCITDSIGSPIDAAVVIAMNPDNGTMLQQCMTDARGHYRLETEGTMQLLITCLGYRQHVSAPFKLDNDTVLPAIRLQADNFVLDDVVIVGEKLSPSIRMEKGKIIYTPRNSSTATGGTALDVLKKTPGVFVDGDNNISIGGQGSVLVIVNGKQTYMQRDELATLLKATPSSSITSVEVIRNPSAQYDAEGSGGIININMSNRKTEGLYISLNNGVSYWDNIRENTELAFSYGNDRLNISANYSHALGHYGMDYGMRHLQNGKEYISPTKDTDKRKTISGSMNLEYALDERQTIGGRIDINTLFGPGQTNTTTEIRDALSGSLEQILYAQNDYYKQKGNRYGGSIYYTANPREGVNYNLDINYAWFDGGSGNWQPNRYVAPDGTLLQNDLYKSVNSRNIHICAASYDQQHNVWNGQLKSGIKFSSVNADNRYRFYDVDDNAQKLDKAQSNDFRYREQIAAAYILYAFDIGPRISIEAGLRGEYTFSDGLLRTISGEGDEENHRDYFDIFPTLSLNWQINASHTLTAGYTSRIDRPAYQDLNPFEYLLDELSYWKGNPFLTPQKTHQVTLGYTHKNTALSLSYSHMQNYKAQITDTLSTDKVIMTPRNIGKQQRVTLSLHQNLNVGHWWEMSVNLTGYYVRNDIAFDQYRTFDLDGFAAIMSMHNTFRLPWRITMELNGSYMTKHLGSSNEYIEPSGYVDIGLSKSFADRSWTINLAMTDIFWTNRWDNYSSFNGFNLWNWGKGESRQIKLNVTYRFGRERAGKHITSFDELERL